jgi:hypothetical protein
MTRKQAARGERHENVDTRTREDRDEAGGRGTDLRDSPMMAYLLDALEAGTDIGHYGRLTFVMVARHFMDEDQLARVLANQPDHDEAEMRGLIRQVAERDYNPPRRERILEWQARQDFPICPDPDDPAACNVYRELRFPDGTYEHIEEFYEEQAQEQSRDRAGS